jgi:hypothetical protein
MDDEIARAQLRRVAADTRAVVARAALGDTVRHWQGHLKDERRVTSIAGLLGVERTGLGRPDRGDRTSNASMGARRTRSTARPAAPVEWGVSGLYVCT